jgi:hypothetical protein
MNGTPDTVSASIDSMRNSWLNAVSGYRAVWNCSPETVAEFSQNGPRLRLGRSQN